ncbi:MAG: porin, partial [Polyangiaceae bacterium]
ATSAAQGNVLVDSDQTARLQALEARVAANEDVASRMTSQVSWLNKFRLTGFVQPQFLFQSYNAAASPNAGPTGLPAGIGANSVIARADGNTTNGSFFRLRRARLKTEFMPTEYARFVFEIDPNLSGGAGAGIGTIARNVEAVGIVPWTRDLKTEFGMGIFKVPFGYEILQSDADRPFIERSWSEQNLFPGEYDNGARAYTTLRRSTLQVAVINGATIGERNFAIVPDLNHGKDIVARFNQDFGVADLGASFDYGQGQAVDPAALKFKQFPRWGLNFELGVHHRFSRTLGATKFFGELTLAKNLDRGTKYGFALPPIPVDVANGFLQDHDERGLSLRIEQDVTHWITLGARYDFYSPDTAQKNDGRDTYSFVGAIHFTKGLQWMFEFDYAIDNVHVPNTPPPSKTITTFSNVLQARF